MLADLRESGAIEANADAVVFLYRDEVYYPESAARGIAELIIGKHRSGPTGTAHVAFLHAGELHQPRIRACINAALPYRLGRPLVLPFLGSPSWRTSSLGVVSSASRCSAMRATALAVTSRS